METLDRIEAFVISGTDRSRDAFMEGQIRDAGLANVTWLLGPNKPNVPRDLIEALKSVDSRMTEGEFSVTLKHFLAMHRFLQTKANYGLIMEDNIEFRGDFGWRLASYIRRLPWNFDLLFDSDLMKIPGKEEMYSSLGGQSYRLKRMSRKISTWSHGASNGANCYLLSRRAAERIVGSFLPFDRVIDHHLNEIIRQKRLVVFWPIPPAVHKIPRPSSVYLEADGSPALKV